ncbi:uncharacterized protein THITE_2087927 [Thermothielavioides terrestris NRRL 8126]|uniref:Uncharacterized protein n=2 Tax=Thermothielavioides terrestris TaxID=2587410 RepID=G2R0I3_THETT|nr:uncharacterized protein THITE_2087927 [Thermothielavioides terrestris NRRL 8126]AEO66451.1 hypothetical protein THITE_2087927 [Thermothielavioides terrestris NRRL 8126]
MATTDTNSLSTPTANKKRPHSSLGASEPSTSSPALPIRALLLHVNTLLSSSRAVTHTLRTAVSHALPDLLSPPTTTTTPIASNIITITDPDEEHLTTTPQDKAEDKIKGKDKAHAENPEHDASQKLRDALTSDSAILRAFAVSPSLPGILAHLGLARELSAGEVARLRESYSWAFYEQGIGLMELEAGAKEFLEGISAAAAAAAAAGDGHGDGDAGGDRQDEGGAAGGSAWMKSGAGVAIAALSNNCYVAEGLLGRLGVRGLVTAVLPTTPAEATDQNEAAATWMQTITSWWRELNSTIEGDEIPPLSPDQVMVVSCAPYDLAVPAAAGCKTCWVRKASHPSLMAPNGSKFDLEVSSLEQLRVVLVEGRGMQAADDQVMEASDDEVMKGSGDDEVEDIGII